MLLRGLLPRSGLAEARCSGLLRSCVFAVACAVGWGCHVPRQVHEPLAYPPHQLQVESLLVRVGGSTELGRGLERPSTLRQQMSERLQPLVAGTGEAIEVRVVVSRVDAFDLVDRRGEMTRLEVELLLEVQVVAGPVVRRGEAHSQTDLSRDEATREELQYVLPAAIMNAFDRFWASESTVPRINRELAAYSRSLKAPLE